VSRGERRDAPQSNRLDFESLCPFWLHLSPRLISRPHHAFAIAQCQPRLLGIGSPRVTSTGKERLCVRHQLLLLLLSATAHCFSTEKRQGISKARERWVRSPNCRFVPLLLGDLRGDAGTCDTERMTVAARADMRVHIQIHAQGQVHAVIS